MFRILMVLFFVFALGCSSSSTSGGDPESGKQGDVGQTDSSAQSDTTKTELDAGASSTDSSGAKTEDTNTLCKDGLDNDGNGHTDCDDFSCSKNPNVTICPPAAEENTNELCSDKKDNYDDGHTDCDDYDCSKTPAVTVCAGGPSTCGDGKCDKDETEASCPKDCAGGTGGPESCVGKCGEYDEDAKCQCDGGCEEYKDCCADYEKVCKSGAPVCGDGKCDKGETQAICPKDCSGATGSCAGKCGEYKDGATCQCDEGCVDYKDCCSDYDKLCTTPPKCGDGKCDKGETKTSCPKDCAGAALSCKGKCGNYISGALCQCDSGCLEYGDCCADFKTLCDLKSETCMTATWQAELKGWKGAPAVVARSSGGFAVAAGAIAVVDALGTPVWKLNISPSICDDPTSQTPKCSVKSVQAHSIAVGPSGSIYAGGDVNFGAGAGAWTQPVVVQLPAQPTSTWAVAAPIASAVDQSATEGLPFGGVVRGAAGGALAYGAREESGVHSPVVQAISSKGAPEKLTTWKLSDLPKGAPGGHSRVEGVAWQASVGLVAVGAVGGKLLAGGGWQSGQAWVGAALNGGKSWQLQPQGITLATDVTLTAAGVSAISGFIAKGAKGGSDGWVAHLDDAGKLLWELKVGGAKDDVLRAVRVVGSETVVMGSTASKGPGEVNLWLLSIDEQGKLLWEQSYGVSGSARYGSGLAIPAAGGFLLAGTLGAADKATSIWLLRVDAKGDGPCSAAAGSKCADASLPCDDGDACTIDACNPTLGTCNHAQAPEGLICLPKNTCALSGACKTGVCEASKFKPDGAACGGNGKCKAGACVGDKPVAPKAGELIFSEIMARSQPGQDDGEYLEIHNTTDKVLDLTGLTLVYKGTVKHDFKAEGGKLSVAPGGYYVIGRTDDKTKNHGASVDYVQKQIGLSNSGGNLALMAGGQTLDKFVYVKTQVVEGVSLQLSKDKLTATDNDDPKSWCPSTLGFGTDGKKGTPGQPNGPC